MYALTVLRLGPLGSRKEEEPLSSIFKVHYRIMHGSLITYYIIALTEGEGVISFLRLFSTFSQGLLIRGSEVTFRYKKYPIPLGLRRRVKTDRGRFPVGPERRCSRATVVMDETTLMESEDHD